MTAGEVHAAAEALQGCMDATLLIVTVAAGGERAGCLVAFHTRVSISPQRHLVALSPRNRTARVAAAATHLAIHTVPSDRRDLAELFGGTTGDDGDKFTRCRWHTGTDGVPILEEAAGWMVGRCGKRISVGDHVAVLLDPVAASTAPIADLLTTRTLGPLAPGHAP